jgi:hypothetical protein
MNYALLYKESGVWAGTTDEERSSLDMIREMLLATTPELENRNFRNWLAAEVGEEVVEIVGILTDDIDDFVDDSLILTTDIILLESLESLDSLQSVTSNDERLAG